MLTFAAIFYSLILKQLTYGKENRCSINAIYGSGGD